MGAFVMAFETQVHLGQSDKYRMKILIYGVNYSPELTGIGKYTGGMAEWLAAHGHQVQVVTAPPYYPEWKVGAGYSGACYRHERLNGVDVWRCPLYVPGQVLGLKRILHLASFAVSSLPVMLRQMFWKPDMIVVIEPPLFCAPIAWLSAKISRAECWLHIQDFEVDAAFDLGIIPYAWMKNFASATEHFLMHRFDVISTISNAMLDRLREKGVDGPVLFPNWADISRMQFDQAGRDLFRTNFEIGNTETLCLYSGNIGAKQGLEILLDVAGRLPDVRFVICGGGASSKNLQLKAEEHDLNNITFFPLQPLDKLPSLLSAADIHLVIQKAGAADLVMPSKLTNILAIGGLALVTAEASSELGRLAEGEGACVCRCDPEDADALVCAILALSNDKVLSKQMMLNAKEYAESHIDMDQVLLAFEERLMGL
jgi:colanic acid biosynthesis glycosyl transferase WcaI